MSQGKTDLPPGMVNDGTKVKIEGEYLSDPSRYMYRLVAFLNFFFPLICNLYRQFILCDISNMFLCRSQFKMGQH